MSRAALLAALLWTCSTLAVPGDDAIRPSNGNGGTPADEDPRALGISDLCQRLVGDAPQEVRVLAAQQLLLRADPEAAAAVHEALRSGAEPVQAAALAAVAAQRDSRFASDIVGLLTSGKEAIARAAHDAAGEIGRPMVPVLAEAYAKLSNGVGANQRLIAALGATRSLAAVPVLLPLLESPREEISAEAQKALALVTRARFRTRADGEAWWQRNRDRGRERILEDALDALENTVRTVDTDTEAALAENRTLKAEIVQLRLDAVRKSGKPDAEVLLLRDLLEDKEKKFHSVRGKILDEIGKAGRAKSAAALPAVLKQIDDPDRKVVLAAVRCLGEIGDAATADAIARFLAPGQDAELRTATARALSRIGTPNVVDPLVRALDEADAAVLLAVLEGVKTVRVHSAIPRLQVILAARGGEPEIAKACVDALGEIGDPGAVPILVDFLAHSDREKDRLARWAAANALGKLKQPQGVDALVALLDDPGAGLRQAAVQALGRIADPRAGEPLARTVRSDQDPVARELAAQALGTLKNPAALDVLLPALDDPEPRVAKSAWASALALAGKDPNLLENLLDKLPPGKQISLTVEVLRLLAPPATLAPESLTDSQKRAQIRLGDLLFQAREWKEAEPVLETSGKWFPDNRTVKHQLGVVYREMQKVDGALAIFTALLEGAEPASREWWEIKLDRLATRLLKKEFEGVLADVHSLLAKDPPPPAELRPRLEQLAADAQSSASTVQRRLEELRRKVRDVVARSRGAAAEALKPLADELAPLGRDAVPLLVEVLQSGDPVDWPAASHHLSVLTNIPGAIAADAPPENREKAIQEWMRWFNGAKSGPAPE